MSRVADALPGRAAPLGATPRDGGTNFALASGIGAVLEQPGEGSPTGWLFGEDQGRYLVTTPAGASIDAGGAVPVRRIGRTGGQSLRCDGMFEVAITTVRDAHEGFFPQLMGPDAALA